jgi:hypothetical protein
MPEFFRSTELPAASFSIRPPPNRACKFPSTRLSSARKSREVRLSPSRLPDSQVPVHLSSFALCPAFPDSDYSDDSVAVGLAPRRQSRGPSIAHVRAWVRSSTHPYTQDHFLGSPRADLPPSRRTRRVPDEPSSDVSPSQAKTTIAEPHRDQLWRLGPASPDRDWSSSSRALTMPRGPRGTFGELIHRLPLCRHAVVPFHLSMSGKPVNPGSLSESLLIE